VSGRKRHLLVGTQGLLVKVKVHSAKVPDKGGIRLLLRPYVSPIHASLICGWTPVTRAKARSGAEQELGLSVEVVHRTPKPTPVRIARIWAEEWSKEGREINWQKVLPRRGFKVLPQRWVVERTLAWLSQNRCMSKDDERLCATGEAFVCAAMSRLMVRRLARS
jgi:putative transposase